MPKEFTATTETLLWRSAAIALICGSATLAGSQLQRGSESVGAPRPPVLEVTQAVSHAPPAGRNSPSSFGAGETRVQPFLAAPPIEADGGTETRVAAAHTAVEPRAERQAGVNAPTHPPLSLVENQGADAPSAAVARPQAPESAPSPPSRGPSTAPVPTLQYPAPIRLARRADREPPRSASPVSSPSYEPAANQLFQRIGPSRDLLTPLEAALRDRSDQLHGSSGRPASPGSSAESPPPRSDRPPTAPPASAADMRRANFPQAPTKAQLGSSPLFRRLPRLFGPPQPAGR